MHEEIQKLIDIARDGGEITEKQKEIILRKAEKLGEDTAEIELILEQKQNSKKPQSAANVKTKCPNCGAVIYDKAATCCPECGYILFPLENTMREIDAADMSFITRYYKRLNALKSYPIPREKDSLLQCFHCLYGHYLSESQIEFQAAYFGKLDETYKLMSQMYAADDEVAKILKDYKFIDEKSKSRAKTILDENESLHKLVVKGKKEGKKGIGCLSLFVLMMLLSAIIGLPIVKHDNKTKEEVWELVQSNDFEGAKRKAKQLTSPDDVVQLTDEILQYQFNYYVNQGNLTSARDAIEDVSSPDIKLNLKERLLKLQE